MRKGLVLASAVVLLAACAVVVLVLLRGASTGGATPTRLLIVLDAGHGGRDPGAVYGGVHEADINLAVLERIAPLIEADERLDVRLTRTLDTAVALEDRIAVANDAEAALYLSIQSNASAHPDASGVETLVSNRAPLDPSLQRLAEVLQNAVVAATGARDRGVRSQDLYLHRAQMPAALIEIGFLSNDVERARLLDPEYQETIAKAIYEGIITYLADVVPSFAQP
jgi:N-acetylmuramoyl-L-alanine amidase